MTTRACHHAWETDDLFCPECGTDWGPYIRGEGRSMWLNRHSLAQALPEHRYCTDNIRGHESCLAVADTILRNLEGGK